MKIATWNIERLKHYKDIALMQQEIDKYGADILVLTETDNRLSPHYPYCYETPLLKNCKSDYYRDTENRVSIFSRYKGVKHYETFDPFTADEWNYDKALSDHKGIWVDMEW